MSQNLSGMRNIILFLVIAIILLTFIFLNSQNKNVSNETIFIGITQWPGSEYLFIAKKEGLFEQVGLNIELVELGSLSEIRRAFEREKICGMTSTLVEVLEAYKNSGRISQPILVTDISNGADVILGLPDIKSMRDLKGKRIGVETGSLSMYMTYRALQLNAIKPSEVTIIPIEPHKLATSLKTGKVDAVTTYPPTSVTLKKLVRVNQLFDSSEIPGEVIDVIAVAQDTIEQNPDLQPKLQQVWALTHEFVKTNPDMANDILIERFPISFNEFKESMNYIEIVNSDNQSKYLKPGGAIQQALKSIGGIVYMDSSSEEIEYTQFIHK